jgi:hypothetical protein
MDDSEKLRVLIPHWIEHNEAHAGEFRQWAAQAGAAETDIVLAAERMGAVNAALADALERLGGALPADTGYDHAHHHPAHHHEE